MESNKNVNLIGVYKKAYCNVTICANLKGKKYISLYKLPYMIIQLCQVRKVVLQEYIKFIIFKRTVVF